MKLEKYSIGVGDRFGREGAHQLAALARAKREGVTVVPVWNKSNREHMLIGTLPQRVREEANAAVKAIGWSDGYYVDADHIGLKTVDTFVAASDFFTLDVADSIGQTASADDMRQFEARFSKYVGKINVPGLNKELTVSADQLRAVGAKYLQAVKEAGRIYRHIEAAKGAGNFVTEVSMDETATSQTPEELFFILGAIAAEGIPAQTIAPKFVGEFHKGVDYIGNVSDFTAEFNADVLVAKHCVKEFGLPENLKLSVHSGSDKFSLYGPMHQAMKAHDAGVHLKTAGTTWLEEVIGLAEAGGDALDLVKDIYAEAVGRFDELCAPYLSVVRIERDELPAPSKVKGWSSEQFMRALRHDQSCPDYDKQFRQLVHVAFKVAAGKGETYMRALDKHAEVIGKNVTQNIYDRHVKPLFLG